MSDSDSAIFFFSGTGNSLAVARQISSGLGGLRTESMAAPFPDSPVGGAGAVAGFVFPSYYGALPRIVKRFVEGITLLPGTFCFTVVTGGGPIAGSSIVALRKALASRQIALDYGKSIFMVGNYIMNYNPPCKEKSVQKMLARTEAAVTKIVADIAARTQGGTHRFHFAADNLYKNIEHLDYNFFADERCRHCGLCERICPVQNIRLENGKPKWQHRCEHCVACIHWCPQEAIQYGNKTKERRRYRYPTVSSSDLIRRENG